MTLNPIDGSADAAVAAAAGFNKIRNKKGKRKQPKRVLCPRKYMARRCKFFLSSLAGFIFLPYFLSLVGIIFIKKWQISTLPRNGRLERRKLGNIVLLSPHPHNRLNQIRIISKFLAGLCCSYFVITLSFSNFLFIYFASRWEF